MIFNRKIYRLFFLIPLFNCACTNKKTIDDAFHFTQMSPAETNISFNNAITESDSVNVFNNEYMYNGSGVGIGDFNNDGLPDVFFCGSMQSSKLYINKGAFTFEDVTSTAGVQTSNWCTGISVVDINADGFMDIYVCASHAEYPAKRKNQLFINEGFSPSPSGEGRAEVHFTEQAAAYGLADTGYATQAAFLDYDKDGDLDMYLLNHRLYSHTANNLQPKDTSGNSPAQDRLYRNEGITNGTKHPVFKEVSAPAGIKEDGYGLGLVITDVNNDNWPDIYVANDYIGNDLLWLNNKNGTFSNVIATALRHQSYNSMGVDAADINNDGLPDIAVVDMLPETNERKKMMFRSSSQEKFDMQQRFGYEPSYMRNMLQLNNGNRMVNNKNEPFYSEIGQLAGIFETDWSWSVLMADFDNDGWKDIHITNGLGKDLTNNDYASFVNGTSNTSNYTFGSSTEKELDTNTIASLRKNIDAFGSIKMDNYFFHNNGSLGFTNTSKQTGLGIPSISNGAAYADLDNDGDLDLVVNNINQEAFVFRNELRKAETDSSNNFVTIQLKGPYNNPGGLGSKITLFNKGSKQFAEQSPVRGFSSSVDYRLHFGVATNKLIDSIQIEWPDDKVEIIKNVLSNRQLVVDHKNAKIAAPQERIKTGSIFTDITLASGIEFKHAEAQNFDFGYHQPLPQKYSQLGPCIATGDINGDGLEDFFVGGAANQPGKIFIQQAAGNFISHHITEGNKTEEDLDAVLFDADGDKDLDLVITGGSFEFTVPKYNQPRLYTNDGKGNFILAADALPVITDITKAITVADYDADGDMDIFIGGRITPQKYPQSPRSYILQNNKGKFSDITKTICPALEFPGLVTAAIFTDFNNDKKPDLIIGGEWMPLRFFKNQNNQLVEVTNETGLTHMNGLWRSLQQADIDKDGDMDYIAGNLGWNNKYHLQPGMPMTMEVKDMDKNGFTELVPAYYIKDNNSNYQLFPALDRNQLSEQLPSVKKKYLLHKDYAGITMAQLKNDYGAADWMELIAETTTSVWIENTGNGKFTAHALPVEAQFAPINSIVINDIDNNGSLDIIVAGNEYQAEAGTGRYDASYAVVLKNDGKGHFMPVNNTASGLIIDGDVKDMKLVKLKNNANILLAAPNDNPLKTFRLN